MTITATTDCSSITITSSNLDLNTYPTITLGYKINPEDSSVEETLYTVQSEDITNNSITITPTFLDPNTTDTTLADGVYCFSLTFSTGNSEKIEHGSTVLLCGIMCNLADYMWNHPTEYIASYVEALKYFTQCNKCDCAGAYDLYQDLLCLIEANPNKNNCGC